MTLSSFSYTAPTLVLFAPDALSRLAGTMKKLGTSRALLVCDPFLEKNGVGDRVREAAGGAIAATWAGVEADAPLASLAAGAEAARSAGADGVLALGGGSAIDSAKVIAALAKHGGDPARWDGAGKVKQPGLPLVAIPTTAGTGSEATSIAVIKDVERSRKLVIIDRAIYPTAAILDPRLTDGLPALLTAATGVDALTHAIEGMVSAYAQPFCTAMGLESVRLIRANLPHAVAEPHDLDARGNMLLAASMAGQLVANTFTGVAHAVAHALGVGWKVHHGTGNAVALAWSVRFNAGDPKAAAMYARIADAWGLGPRATASDLADAIEGFTAELGLPRGLSKVGVQRGELDRLAELAFADPSHVPNPVKVANAGELRRALDSLF